MDKALAHLTVLEMRSIAASSHRPDPAEYWVDGVAGEDIEHPAMYSWGNRDEEETKGCGRLHWHVQELRESPRNCSEAELGWYVIFHPGGGGNSYFAVEGPFETWEKAAEAADRRAPRAHLYRDI